MIKTIISRHTPRHYLSFLEDVKGAVIWQCIMYRVTGARVRRCPIRAAVGARATAMRVGGGGSGGYGTQSDKHPLAIDPSE